MDGSDAGDKKVRKELRAALKNFGLPVTGELFNKTYEYVRENYRQPRDSSTPRRADQPPYRLVEDEVA